MNFVQVQCDQVARVVAGLLHVFFIALGPFDHRLAALLVAHAAGGGVFAVVGFDGFSEFLFIAVAPLPGSQLFRL